MIFLPTSLFYRSSHSRNSNWYSGPTRSATPHSTEGGVTRSTILVMDECGPAPELCEKWMENIKEVERANKKWWQIWK